MEKGGLVLITIFNEPICKKDNRFSSNILLSVLGSTITSDYINEVSHLPGKFLRIEYLLPVNFISLLEKMRNESKVGNLNGILTVTNLKGKSSFKMINLSVNEPFEMTNGVIKLLGYIDLNSDTKFPVSEFITHGVIHNFLPGDNRINAY